MLASYAKGMEHNCADSELVNAIKKIQLDGNDEEMERQLDGNKIDRK